LNTEEPVETRTEEFNVIEAALYDSILVALPLCPPTVANTVPTLDPEPNPDATRPINELSLLQALLSEAVDEFELDNMEKRRRPLKSAIAKYLPRTVTDM